MQVPPQFQGDGNSFNYSNGITKVPPMLRWELRTYIRPLQRDLDLSKADEHCDVVSTINVWFYAYVCYIHGACIVFSQMEKCLTCGSQFPMEELPEHLKYCNIEL